MQPKMSTVSVPKPRHLQLTIQYQDHRHYLKTSMMRYMSGPVIPVLYLRVYASSQAAYMQRQQHTCDTVYMLHMPAVD